MSAPLHIGVIDVGKTNAKLAVVDLTTLREIGVLTRPNQVLPGPPWPHFDLDGIWAFLLSGLKALHRAHRIDAISITAHGASAVLLAADGTLAAPMLDYEHDGPDSLAAAYDAIRPPFAETGSPRLALGLNVGAQVHWQFATDPGLRDRTALLVTYPQYWAHRLTGVAATEVTSLACHTDLWNPTRAEPSSLVATLGLTGRLAPLHDARDRLGPILPQVAASTGLPPETPVLCGIHDSNASLYPHLLTRPAPFTVVSTGTWVILLAIGGKPVTLDPARDTLLNVNCLGQPTPSSRFMGGRSFERMMEGHAHDHKPADIAAVLTRGLMLLPSVDPLSGPYMGRAHCWTEPQGRFTDGERFVALSWHLALMASVSLEVIGADGPTLVEGPFARNPLLIAMLATATGRPVEAATASATGTSIGAALLAAPAAPPREQPPAPPPVLQYPDPALAAYALAWRKLVDQPG